MIESDKESDRKWNNKVNFDPSLDKSAASLVYSLKKSEKMKKKVAKTKWTLILQESDKERSHRRATLQAQKSHFQHSVS